MVPRRPRRLRRRSRTPASRSPTPTARSAWPATTTSRWSRCCRSRTSRAAPRSPPSWTREVIPPETREYLLSLSSRRAAPRALGLFHASPRDPVWEYVLSAAGRRAVLRRDRLPDLVHRPLARGAVVPPAGGLAGDGHRRAGRAPSVELQSGEWLINPGSTGQPRDGDPRAAWLMLDTGEWTADVAPRRVRHRGRPGRDPRGEPPRLARRAAPIRAMNGRGGR